MTRARGWAFLIAGLLSEVSTLALPALRAPEGHADCAERTRFRLVPGVW